ncbi:MAG: T9SS type A sorting domain-containing protein [Ignavibacteria bacterium]|nr:T9SS type A sorting domain-containing protein [Ignavibacteria bacterium]
MKRTMLLVIIALLLTNLQAFSQSFNAVKFIDASTASAVGTSGAIIRSSDGGSTWSNQSSGVSVTLSGLSFPSAGTGTVVGGDFFTGPVITHTTNGGANWNNQAAGTSNSLTDVFFVDANIGIAVGNSGTILRTTNGGSTWSTQTSGTTYPLYGVSFADQNTGVAVGYAGMILRTTNGGVGWTTQVAPNSNQYTLYDISFGDVNNGTAVGDGGTILRTSNGGSSWSAQSSGATRTLYGVSMVGSSTGTVVGNGGLILRTTNSGATWTTQAAGQWGSYVLYGVSFINANNGVAVGSSGLILQTVDGGSSWTQRLVSSGGSPPSVMVNSLTVCSGTSGTLTATVTGGTSPYTYSWNTGATTQSITTSTAGTYTVTVTDSKGATATSSGTLTVNLPPSVSVNSLTVCSGSSGTLTATVTGGTSPYTYLWNTGATTPSITTSTGGTYSVTVTDSKGCSGIGSGILTVNPPMTMSLASTNVSCNGGANGSITATFSGGLVPYTIQIDGGAYAAATSPKIFYSLAAGAHTVYLKDALGCIVSQSVTLTQPAALTLSLSSSNVSCNGGSNGTITLTATGGTSPYSYSKDGGVTFQASNIFSGLAAATYSIAVKDANGCLASQSVTITQPAAIAVNLTETDVSCFGAANGTISITASGGTSPYTYSKDGITFQSTSSFTGLTAGSYTITVKDVSGCTNAASTSIAQPAQLSCSVASVAVCAGSSGTLTALVSGGTSPYTYNWSTGATTSSITASTAGTYNVTVTDAKGCTATASGTLTVNSLPVLTCTGDSLTSTKLTATTTVSSTPSTGVSYSWSGAGLVSGGTTSSATWNQAGPKTVVVTNTSTGCQSSCVSQVTQVLASPPPAPILSAPANGSTGQVTTLTLAWNASSGATSYRLQVATDSNFVSKVLDDSTLTTTSRSVGPLLNNTKYYWHVNAKNSSGTSSYSSFWNFTTVPLPPTVTTTAATSVTSSSGTLNGTVNPNGAATTAWFEWGTSSTLATYTSTTSQSIGSGTSAVSVSAGLTGLSPNTTYYYRIAGQNSAGTQKDGILSFTTSAVLPTAVTTAATSVTSSSGTLNGTVNPNGAATNAWFEWGTSSTLATFTSTTSQSIGSGTSAVSVSAGLTGLSANTTYYYRVVGQNSAGTQKDGILSFTTSAVLPTVTTTAATSVTSTAATLNGTVNPNGAATNAWFEWGTSSTLATYTSTTSQSIGSGTSTVSVSSGLTGLSANTTYYYRVVGQNGAGTQKDGILSFTTSAVLPTVTTTAATLVTSSSGTLNGTVNPNGAATTAWFEWGTSSTLATYTSTTSQSIGSGTSAVSVSAGLTGLSANTTYYYRVAGQNSAGTQRDGILNFVTPPPPAIPSPSLLSPADASTGQPTTVTLSWSASSGATSYRVQVSTSSLFTSVVLDDSTVTTTSRQVSGLLNNTTYYWRVNAKGSSGTSNWSSTWSFTTVPLPPTVTTTAATSVTSSSGTLNGTVNPNGAATNAWFEWGTSSTLATFTSTTSQSIGSGTSAVSVSAGLTGSSANTTYYYRVAGQNSAGTQKDSILSFTTSAVLPTAVTTAATSVTSTSGTLNGTVNPNGAATTAWFEWGTSSTLATYTSTTSQSIGSGTSAVSVSTNLTGLSAGTIYYYRMVGQNSAGTQRDGILSFTTTVPVTKWTLTAASLNPSSGVGLTASPADNNGLTSGSTLLTLNYNDGTVANLTVPATVGGNNFQKWQLDGVDYSTSQSVGITVNKNCTLTAVYVTPPPAAPVLISPVNGATNQATTLTLSWNPSSGAASYRLQVSTGTSFSSLFLDDSTLTTTSRQVSSLAGGITYYWRVNAMNSGGTSPWSTVWSFKTKKGGKTRLSTASINFGPVAVATSEKDSFGITNIGDTTVNIINVVSTDQVFKVNQRGIAILPGDTQQIYVVAAPDTPTSTVAWVIVTYDDGLPPDTIIAQVDSVSGITGVDDDKSNHPVSFALHQNYPNPFNPMTRISFSLPTNSTVTLRVLNLLGQEVATLFENQSVNEGDHTVEFEGTNLASGAYFYRIDATAVSNPNKTFTQIHKMVLMK